jgi:protein-S-isoprenylcysteine O-methyltransferase Ste14
MESNPQPDSPGVKVPPPFFYAAGVLLGAWLDHVMPLFTYAVRPARFVAIGCAVLWLVLMLGAVGLFRRARTSIVPIRPASVLVVEGVYRFTRNPMYLSLVFLYLTVTLWFGLAWPWVFLPVVIACIHRLVIAREERYLLRRFGRSYLDYQQRVRRWL